MLYTPAPKTTLAHWLKGKALGAFLDRQSHKVISVATSLQQLGWFGTSHKPDNEAVSLYLLNHAVSTISARRDAMEPLPNNELQIVERYITRGSEVGARLFYYVLLITAREARHNQSSGQPPSVQAEMNKAYPGIDSALVSKMYSFLRGYQDSSSSALNQLSQIDPSWEMGPFCKLMSVVYYKCSWSSAYGGPKWGNIADCLYRFVTGEWSAELFADTAFTLAHNTAPIFNKGMLYTTPGPNFIKILDCQRAGMIPQLIAEGGTGGMNGIGDDIAFVKQRMPDLIQGTVDWQKVQELGAVGHYASKPKKTSSAPYKPTPAVPPPGCSDKVVQIDYQTSVHLLLERAA